MILAKIIILAILVKMEEICPFGAQGCKTLFCTRFLPPRMVGFRKSCGTGKKTVKLANLVKIMISAEIMKITKLYDFSENHENHGN